MQTVQWRNLKTKASAAEMEQVRREAADEAERLSKVLDRQKNRQKECQQPVRDPSSEAA